MKKFLINHWSLILALLVFISITIPALFQKQHVLKNLEPYPDSILYLDRAKNLVEGRGFLAGYANSELKIEIPPLYSLYLAPFFIFTKSPIVFVFANIVLGLISIIFLYLILLHLSSSRKTKYLHLSLTLSLILYLSHAYLIWMPGLALIENLGLTLLLINLYVFIVKKAKISPIFAAFLTGAWIFAKLNYIGLSTLLFCLFSFVFYKKMGKKKLFVYWLWTFCLAIIYLAYEEWTGHSHIGFFTNLIYSKDTDPEIAGNNTFFSFSYLSANLNFYLKTFLGSKTKVIWNTWPITNVVLFSSAMFTIYWKLRNSKSFKELFFSPAAILLWFFLAQFPILLVFSAYDARYVMLSVPIFIIAINLFLKDLNKSYLLVISYWLLVIGLQAFQLPFFKRIVAENIFGRSQAWQYEAVKNFEDYFDHRSSTIDHRPLLVSALPPIYFDLYNQDNYQVLPLSKNQEFINKRKWLWNSEFKTDNLIELFQRLINNNQDVYISNAYITHNHEVIADYEVLKEQFDFELVKKGCDNACNVYQLTIKN